MKKRNGRIFTIVLVLSLLLCNFQTAAVGDSSEVVAIATEAYSPDVVKDALLFEYEDSQISSMATRVEATGYSAVLSAVLQPVSMDITIPKIDSSRIVPLNSKLLCELGEYEVFYEELSSHGYADEKIEAMTYEEYEALESTWAMDSDHVDVFKKLHPELEDEDLTAWTIGDSEEYTKAANLEELSSRFTEEELAELDDRGILIEDTRYLFKEYHTIGTILSKTNAELRTVLEEYYIFNLGMTLGFDFAEELLDAQRGDAELMSTPTYSLPSSAASYYEWVDFPKYGGDYFHNDVLTSAYWRNIQAYRTLLTESVLYGISYAPTNTLHCSNLYGTYSRSQGGAHEGIDFALDQTYRYISSPVYGFDVVDGKQYHQQAIYDADHPDGGKTYSFLHLSSVEAVDEFYVGTRLGRQGAEGNATGVHVHFEVHYGESAALSAENNHIIGSISPYRLTEYIGEAAQS